MKFSIKKNPLAKVLKFSYDEEVPLLSGPTPSKKHLPDWYKKTPMFSGDGKAHISGLAHLSTLTVKACAPFMDAMTSGYVVELPMDIEVVRELLPSGDYRPIILWPVGPPPLNERPENGRSPLPIPVGHAETHFFWQNQIIMQLPKGYSMLVTHPLNRYDLPFTTLSAIVDADINPMSTGAVAFFVRDNFEGIIPRGTPMYQIIPFKRESWLAKFDAKLFRIGQKATALSLAHAHGFYKRFSWSKKEFN